MAGGGIGEAMLISAAVGGGTSLLTNKDPLEGALMGAVMGGAGAGLGAFGAATPAAAGAGGTAATTAATTAAPTAASGITSLPAASNAGAMGSGYSGVPLAAPAMPPPQAMTPAGMPSQLGADATMSSRASQLSAAAQPPAAAPAGATAAANPTAMDKAGQFMDKTGKYWDSRTGMQQLGLGMAGASGSQMVAPDVPEEEKYKGPLSKYKFNGANFRPSVAPNFADGGITSLRPPITVPNVQDIYPQRQQFARGGVSSLGSYSDGGRLLRGPGDGVSDGIPAHIAGKQPAALADGEFVVPARIVSELGNGSTDAGARQLYAMMKRVQQARKGTARDGKFAMDSNAARHLPA